MDFNFEYYEELIQSPENKSSVLYDMNLHRFFQYCSSLNSIFSVIYYITISYDTVNYQNLTIFSSESTQHYMLMNESVVSPVSKRYMRAGIGNDRLVVCLSEYLPLRIVYHISSMSTIA